MGTNMPGLFTWPGVTDTTVQYQGIVPEPTNNVNTPSPANRLGAFFFYTEILFFFFLVLMEEVHRVVKLTGLT